MQNSVKLCTEVHWNFFFFLGSVVCNRISKGAGIPEPFRATTKEGLVITAYETDFGKERPRVGFQL